jgi:hypothetical protein
MGDVIGRLGWQSAVGGRDDEDTANGGPGKNSARKCQKLKNLISKLNAPILNKLSIFDTPEGRLGGLCGGDGRVETCSFFGLVERDQGANGRPKSGLDRRFSLVEVGCANGAEAGTGGGGMRGSYAINGSLTPMPESFIRCGDIGRA